MTRALLILLLVCFMACGPRSPEDCRSQAEGIVRKLTKELSQIETSSDLRAHAPKLRILYEQLADVMIRVEKHHDTQGLREREPDWQLNQALQAQLARVSSLDGGKETLEKAQRGALSKLSQRDFGRSEIALDG